MRNPKARRESILEIWHNAALEYSDQGLSQKEVTEKIEKEFGLSGMYNAVHSYIWRHRKKSKEQPEKPEEAKHVVVQNQEPKRYEGKWDGTDTITFGLMGDTQFGSKYAQITYLHDFYDLCEREGIVDIYHTGDITDGLKMRQGHEYELYEISAEGQCADVVKNYPRRKGITTHFITGNHDASLYKQVGYDVGMHIAKEREDMHYLGRDCAVVNITPNCTLELRHPWDGTAYAISYKIQKMIEAMEADSKPNILGVGHYHKEETMFYRNIHAIQTACFQSQTPFTRGKGIYTVMGGFIITVRVDKNGYIQGFRPEFIPYYKPIKDDYKNFTR
jgi:UDP-2,3-diacylglucosamine pyrophosphatase LpxH